MIHTNYSLFTRDLTHLQVEHATGETASVDRDVGRQLFRDGCERSCCETVEQQEGWDDAYSECDLIDVEPVEGGAAPFPRYHQTDMDEFDF